MYLGSIPPPGPLIVTISFVITSSVIGSFSGNPIPFDKSAAIEVISSLIKGELGSVVKLTVFRPSMRKKISFDLTRANIVVKHVPYGGIDEDGIGYIRITKFSRNTFKDFSEALNALKDQNLLGLVIDLRSNSGGLLKNAINMGIYKPVDYKKKPKSYCGMTITDNPFFD